MKKQREWMKPCDMKKRKLILNKTERFVKGQSREIEKTNCTMGVNGRN